MEFLSPGCIGAFCTNTFEGGTEYVRADVLAEAVGLIVQYRDDLRHVLSDDSRGRRLAAIATFLANQGKTK
jgi:hypothetical protein